MDPQVAPRSDSVKSLVKVAVHDSWYKRVDHPHHEITSSLLMNHRANIATIGPPRKTQFCGILSLTCIDSVAAFYEILDGRNMLQNIVCRGD